jgi:hypothetical protein
LVFGHGDPSPCFSLFLSYSFCKPTKGREKTCWGFPSGVQGFANPFLLSFAAWTRGRRGARGRRCQNPSLSLCSSTRHRTRPPVTDRRPADTLEPAPPCRDPKPAPHAALAVAMATVGMFVWLARNRPFLDPSTRHWPRTDPLDQFPEPDDRDPNRTRRHDLAKSTPPCSPAHAERVAHSCAPAYSLALHFTHVCTAPRGHHDVALPSYPVHHSLPTEHRFPRSFSETGEISRDSASHRHHFHVLWTQLTVPPRTAAHGTQW